MNLVKMQTNTKWRLIHWRSIEAAYRNSPYFEFYETDLKIAYDYSTDLLFEFNLNFTRILLSIYKIYKPIALTEEYVKVYSMNFDFRHTISPKKIEINFFT